MEAAARTSRETGEGSSPAGGTALDLPASMLAGNGPPANVVPSGDVDVMRETSRIYSSADPDVTPPEIRNPQLPPPLLSGVHAEVNTIELIVTEDGTVDRVRLVSAPRRMSDMMLLSGAKTWRFEPALRDGRPVKYRLLLSWDATP